MYVYYIYNYVYTYIYIYICNICIYIYIYTHKYVVVSDSHASTLHPIVPCPYLRTCALLTCCSRH